MYGSIPESKLQVVRLLRGMTQTQISIEADISVPTLSYAERLQKEPSERVKKKLEKYYSRRWADMYQPINLADLL